MSGHDSDNIRDNDDNTNNNNRNDGLEFFKPDWGKYNDLMNKSFDEFTQGEQKFFRNMNLWEEMGYGTCTCNRAECSEDC